MNGVTSGINPGRMGGHPTRKSVRWIIVTNCLLARGIILNVRGLQAEGTLALRSGVPHLLDLSRVSARAALPLGLWAFSDDLPTPEASLSGSACAPSLSLEPHPRAFGVLPPPPALCPWPGGTGLCLLSGIPPPLLCGLTLLRFSESQACPFLHLRPSWGVSAQTCSQAASVYLSRAWATASSPAP